MKHHFKSTLIFVALILMIPFAAFIRQSDQSLTTSQSSSSETSSDMPSEKETDTKSKKESKSSSNSNKKSNDSKNLTVFNHTTKKKTELSMNEYLEGVVFAEMPASFEEEALKAQVVVAHTYTLRIIKNEQASPSKNLKGADISTDPSKHQAYLSKSEAEKKYGDDYKTYSKKISDCVKQVSNEILTYQDEPIVAAFHAISAGNTESAENVWGEEIPYLVSTESEGDLLSPSFEDSLTLTSEEVKNILSKDNAKLTFPKKKKNWFSDVKTTESGYVDSLKVGKKSYTGQEIRTLFGLKSSNFTITYNDNKFTFQTKGYGHGVGMSQYGADYMARQGTTYDKILSHYYPETTLTTVS